MEVTSAVAYSDSRRELRNRAAGVLLIQVSPNGEIIPTRLLDVSAHGFCAVHQYDGLRAGQQVSALYSWGEVVSRVVWIRAHEDGFATGFQID